MLFGIPLCAFALKTMTDMIFGEEKEKIKLMMVQGLTSEKFDSMHEFCQELADINAGKANSHRLGMPSVVFGFSLPLRAANSRDFKSSYTMSCRYRSLAKN